MPNICPQNFLTLGRGSKQLKHNILLYDDNSPSSVNIRKWHYCKDPITFFMSTVYLESNKTEL